MYAEFVKILYKLINLKIDIPCGTSWVTLNWVGIIRQFFLASVFGVVLKIVGV